MERYCFFGVAQVEVLALDGSVGRQLGSETEIVQEPRRGC